MTYKRLWTFCWTLRNLFCQQALIAAYSFDMVEYETCHCI